MLPHMYLHSLWYIFKVIYISIWLFRFLIHSRSYLNAICYICVFRLCVGVRSWCRPHHTFSCISSDWIKFPIFLQMLSPFSFGINSLLHFISKHYILYTITLIQFYTHKHPFSMNCRPFRIMIWIACAICRRPMWLPDAWGSKHEHSGWKTPKVTSTATQNVTECRL